MTVSIISNRAGSISFESKGGVSALLYFGANTLSLAEYKSIKEDDAFKHYVNQDILTIQISPDLDQDNIKQPPEIVVEANLKNTEPPWAKYTKANFSKKEIRAIADDEYNIQLDGRSSFPNLILEFKTEYKKSQNKT